MISVMGYKEVCGLMSGRMRIDAKRTADSCFSLDVNWLKQKGYFKEGRTTESTCTQRFRNSGRYLETHIIASEDELILKYKLNNENVSYQIEIDYSDCNYGGSRPWFVCPNTRCNKRVGKLFLDGRYYLCRHCHNLSYETQNISEADRLVEKAQKIRMRFGAESLATTDPFPPRPKGMHYKTYFKARREYHDLVNASWGLMAQRFGIQF
jgi:hypothetical protein